MEKHIKESPHLLWREGGVPCLDAKMWDKFKDRITVVKVYTDKGRLFEISELEFEHYRKELDLGCGRQYYVDKKHWNIINK